MKIKLHEGQYGFRQDLGNVDAIFITRQIIEKRSLREKNPITHWCYSSEIVGITKYMFDNIKCAVTIDNHPDD